MYERHKPGSVGDSQSRADQSATPGRRTLTEQLPAGSVAPGRRTLTEALPVQQKAQPGEAKAPDSVQQVAEAGVAQADGALPFAAPIQTAFGMLALSASFKKPTTARYA